MIAPLKVNPANFVVHEILYNLNGFSIAIGLWEDGSKRIAMRWDGEADDDNGYPKTFGHPMWFQLPLELTLPILELLDNVPTKYYRNDPNT